MRITCHTRSTSMLREPICRFRTSSDLRDAIPLAQPKPSPFRFRQQVRRVRRRSASVLHISYANRNAFLSKCRPNIRDHHSRHDHCTVDKPRESYCQRWCCELLPSQRSKLLPGPGTFRRTRNAGGAQLPSLEGHCAHPEPFRLLVQSTLKRQMAILFTTH